MLPSRLLVVTMLSSLSTSAPLEPQNATTTFDTTDRKDVSGEADDLPQKYFRT